MTGTGMPFKIFGGRNKIDDPKEYEKAIEKLKGTGLSEQNGFKINEAYKQVVNGMLYTFNCEVKTNIDEKFKPCVIQILNQPWKRLNYKVVKNTCKK